jgi:hypothetical protein
MTREERNEFMDLIEAASDAWEDHSYEHHDGDALDREREKLVRFKELAYQALSELNE